MRCGHVAMSHVERQRPPINSCLEPRILKNRFQLRSKNKISPHKAVIQRLNSQAITYQEKSSLLAVPEGESEHADKPLHRWFNAPSLNCFQHHLRIGVPSPIARWTQVSPDLFKVVNLSVENDRIATGSRVHRLMPRRRQIKNG